MRQALPLLFLALPLGCHPEPPRPVPDTGLPTPQVELGGAARVEPAAGGPVPVFGPKHLPVVWVDAQGVEAQSPLAMAWRAKGTSALPVTTVPIQGGNRLTVEAGPSVPEGDGALVLTLAGREVWSTAARWASGPEPNWPEVEAARAAARRGDPEAAATAWLSAVELVPPTHSERTRRRIAAAHSLWAIGDFERALQVLEAAPAPIPLLEAERLRTRSVLHRSLGQFRPAERELDQVERLSERFNLALVAHLARESRALLLDELGRAAEAVAVIESAAPYARRQGGQALARWRANRGWLHLRAWTPGPTSQGLQRARADLSAALEWDWPGPTRANILSSLAWLELLEARPAAARRHLDEADVKDQRTRGNEWGFRVWLRGQLLLAEGSPTAAAAHFEQLATHSLQALPDGGDLGWRARFGQGQAARALADLPQAAAHFDAALALLDRVSRRAALRGGQATFLDSRRDLVNAALELHLRAGRPARAFAVADQARGRLLQGQRTRSAVDTLSPDDRTRWTEAVGRLAQRRRALEALEAELDLTAGAARDRVQAKLVEARAARDQAADGALGVLGEAARGDPWRPPALAVDEALLEAHRLGDGWVVFLVRPSATATQRDPADLLTGWGAHLDGVQHLYVVPGGHPQAASLEARFPGQVSWLPAASLLARPEPPRPDRVVAVVDPDGTLPGDRALGHSIAGRPHDAVLTGPQATRPALLGALAGAGTFYFGGHGVLDRAQPWAAHLRLADDQRLDVTDALMAQSPGAVVFLNGCETGPVDTFQRADVLGLPEAFLVAGARSVIAAERPVPDEAATRFARAFFAAGGGQRPAAALAQVRAALKAQGDPIWDAYHLFGRR